MLKELKQHITKKFPFIKGKKLLLAVSGGVDSMVLTQLLHQLEYKIAIAHCNFKLREEESDLDQLLVQNLANQLKIQFFTTSFKTKHYAKKNKLSTQVAARNLRYRWFSKILKKEDFHYIITAHHADDNLETFLINTIRGTGLEGLTGIPEINGNVVRPLLIFSRNDILNFAAKNNIIWREDTSNNNLQYVRNKIRKNILPILKEINPNLLVSFKNTTNNLQESQFIIHKKITEILKSKYVVKKGNNMKFSISFFESLENPKAYLYEILKPYKFTEWKDVVHLFFKAQSGKQIFSKTHRLIKDREYVLLTKIKEVNTKVYTIKKGVIEIQKPIRLQFTKVNKIEETNQNSVYINKCLLKFPLLLRKWKKGDYFYPANFNGKKKLSNYFVEKKLSILDKEKIWLLCSGDEIVWIVGVCLDYRFLPKTNTYLLKITHLL